MVMTEKVKHRIVSASRRTDIPAFFGRWFMRRVEAGYCYSVNPFNPAQKKTVSLKPEDVRALVFWTKHPAYFLSAPEALEILEDHGLYFYFQYTLNDYPAAFEPHMPNMERKVAAFKFLAEKLGPSRVLWRYDPIIISSLTPVAYHLEKMHRLASALSGWTERLTVSLVDYYMKTRRRFQTIAQCEGIRFGEFSDLSVCANLDEKTANSGNNTEAFFEPGSREQVKTLTDGIKAIAKEHALTIQSCCDPLLAAYGILPGSCVEGAVSDTCNLYKKDRHQRKHCLCRASIDIGAYDTCGHYCTYCYGYASAKSVQKNWLKHYQEDSPALVSRS